MKKGVYVIRLFLMECPLNIEEILSPGCKLNLAYIWSFQPKLTFQKSRMTYWNKSAFYGGIYASSLHGDNYTNEQRKINFNFQRFAEKIKGLSLVIPEIRVKLYNQAQAAIRKNLPAARGIYLSNKRRIKSHISRKQEVYWPVLIAITLLLFVFASRIATAATDGAPNNLPISENPKLNFAGLPKPANEKLCAAQGKNTVDTAKMAHAEKEFDEEKESLKNDVSDIVENTPMAAMIDPIADCDRTVAAFIVGIAMKESKFGVYAPHIAGRDCYNYWGLKAGGKTVSGGYTCFSTPEDAVETVAKNIERMVAKGVRTPAQAISWKCGSSCAGHDAAGVRKWIADVAINFNKINS